MPQSTLLVVDDNPENLLVLAELLQSTYRVLAANSGPRALELAAGNPRPDLILLDVMMPAMDGYEVLARLRRDRATEDIPVIFVTAMDATEDEQAGLSLGAVDYITKPVRPGILLARVRTQLELRDARLRLEGQKSFLEAEIARRMRENQLIQDVSIHALARLAETRDPETAHHLRRTQEFVRVLAQRLRNHPRFAPDLDDRMIDVLVKSAPLHDIGKVGIPDHILQKPGPLTAHEWELMKQHAEMGAEALERAERDAHQPVEFLFQAKQIARSHHERWDGNGYPDRLAGEAIPVGARLMAIADVFDALTSWRCYRRAIPYAEARTEVVNERGTRFDPDMVDAFVAGFDEICGVATRFGEPTGTAAVAGSAPGVAG